MMYPNKLNEKLDILNTVHCESEKVNTDTNESLLLKSLKIFSDIDKLTFFKERSLSVFSLTSNNFKNLVSSELTNRKVKKLLSYVLTGNQNSAQTLVENNPKLILLRAKAQDYSGRVIEGTAFQAAIGSGDKPMWEMLLNYFDDQKEALRQFDKQFPNGIRDNYDLTLQDYYNSIAIAIVEDEDNGSSVIELFRKKVTYQKEIFQSKHFNLQHLIAAFQTYVEHFEILDAKDSRDIFWLKVIGYMQRQITAYDAQIHCSGIKSVLSDNGVFNRQFTFQNGGKFFPLEVNAGLGFEFACNSYIEVAVSTSNAAPLGVAEKVCSELKKLESVKVESLVELRSFLEQQVRLAEEQTKNKTITSNP